MKKILILLFFIILVHTQTLNAQEFNMKILRINEKKLALNEFKKLYKKRKNFKHQLYQKTKHKRSKKIKKDSILHMQKEHNLDELQHEMQTDMHNMTPSTEHLTHPTMHNMTDIQIKTNQMVDIMSHETPEDNHMDDIINDEVILKPNIDTSEQHTEGDDNHVDNDHDTYLTKPEIKTKSTNPWARKK